MIRIPSAVVCTALFVLILDGIFPALSAQTQDASDSARLGAIARDAARRFVEAKATGEQTRPAEPPPPPGLAVEVTLDGAVQRALERNLDISVERLNPQAFDYSLAALNATYRPTLTSNFGLRSQSQFPRSQTAGADMLVTETLTGNTGVTQNLKWGGGSVAMAFNNNRQAQSDAFATRNPAINANLSFSFVQPLLRSFRIDGTRAQLQITQLNQQISEIDLRATLVRTIADVRDAYWDLIYAIEAAEVAENSLALASKLVQDNQIRVEAGTLAPLDVVQAQAEEASRRQTVAQTTVAKRTAELALKRLIVSGTDDPYWTATLNPVDRPTYSLEPVDVEAAVARALRTRTDLEQSRRMQQANAVSIRTFSDARLPALDFSGGYGVAGVGGTQFIRNGLGGAVSQTVPSGYWDALRILGNQDAPTWNFGLAFSYPIGTSPAEANLARARLQQRQTIAQSRQLELQVATEVTTAALQVDANRERLQAAMAALALAERRLEAEQSRFEVGLSTNFFVVQAQRDLRDSQNAQLRALLDYRQSQVAFERVQEIPTAGGPGLTSIQPTSTQAPRASIGGFGN